MADRALALRPRVLPAQDRGRLLDASQVAEHPEICNGRFSPKWVIQRMRSVGRKPGREWLFYEADAKAWWQNFYDNSR